MTGNIRVNNTVKLNKHTRDSKHIFACKIENVLKYIGPT